MEGSATPPVSQAVAERIASALGQVPAIAATLVASSDGLALASSRWPDAESGAALAAFVGERMVALSADGDLRGMGRLVAEGRPRHVSIAGPGGEQLLVSLAGGWLLAKHGPGQAHSALQSATAAVRRYNRPPPAPTGGNPQ